MMRSHTRRGLFQKILDDNNEVFKSDPLIKSIFQKKQQIWKARILDPPVFFALKNSGNIGPDQGSNSVFETSKTIKIGNKPHSIKDHLPGNSYISYYHSSNKCFGSIINIVRLSQEKQPLLVVQSLLPLDISDRQKSPFYQLPELLNAAVIYDSNGEYHVIDCRDVVGQLVVVINPSGTFGICQKTLSIVEIMNYVSLLNCIYHFSDPSYMLMSQFCRIFYRMGRKI